MEKEFVSYELAVKLKALGFDEPCFGVYDPDSTFCEVRSVYSIDFANNIEGRVLAPTFSQAFRWFREKYNLHIGICHAANGKFDCWTNNGNLLGNGVYTEFDTYEEAELACLTKLIEIVESKSE